VVAAVRVCCATAASQSSAAGWDYHTFTNLSSCEALTLAGSEERWDPLPPMYEARRGFACASIGGCVIVAGGADRNTVEVYQEGLRRWRQLPCRLPDSSGTGFMGSVLL
jgi:hypothetical protein